MQAFPVLISSAETVGDLKDLVKAEQSPDFDAIVANKIKLWKVSIPDDGNVPILRDNQSVENQLRATSELFEVFKNELKEMKEMKGKADLPKDTIHILVERPPPGNAHTRAFHSNLIHSVTIVHNL
ncbi:hypothetical protein BGZ97_001874 [Linnemannia gamsii]|uniref:Crinkler effector protein N-terminal domain-containing protein n=1 Tax=Linnemannia gamsii TaxID=64522 RepID=A0A9P6QZP7_9FUNG|nr:hypothetical protein BGZ97_001874 [Linnemannia gamsii]